MPRRDLRAFVMTILLGNEFDVLLNMAGDGRGSKRSILRR